MSRRIRRILITSLIVLAVAGVMVTALMNRPKAAVTAGNGSVAKATQPSGGPDQPATQAAAQPAPSSSPAETAPAASATSPTTGPAAAPLAPPPAAATQPIPGLKAIAPGNDLGLRSAPPQSLGSLDPRVARMQLEFSRQGAGIASIPFSNIWETAAAKRQADKYLGQLAPGAEFDLARVNQSERYVLQTAQPFIWSAGSVQVPVMAAHSIVINGDQVLLLNEAAWSETAPGQFQTRIVDADEKPILEITRRFVLGAAYDITLYQRVHNLSGQSLQVQWRQYGPVDLRTDLTGYIDRRRFAFGYLADPKRFPDLILSGDADSDRQTLVKLNGQSLETPDRAKKRELLTLWPNKISTTRGYELAWLASTNRYFSLAVHQSQPAVVAGARALEPIVQKVEFSISAPHQAQETIFSSLSSPITALAPGGEAAFDLGIYAGPLDRSILDGQPYDLLAMQEMVLYRMAGGCCTFMTFQWLAKLLLAFLALLHDYVVFDWGMAIILLVVFVRILLHPLTKKSQISIQRFGKKMSALKPEIDKLQKKFGSDPKRMQQEQMKLMREQGINPFQMLGCLPMFLQTPIWIALWAMLYLAFDIRHQPALYGLFQLFGGWPFLGDLSSPDDFWILPGGGFTIPLVGWAIPSVNLLPLLLGVVFWIQQKYMSPPPSPTMTPEQAQQQKIMKVMMVVMFPLFLYKAPSGLTLYIFTSTVIGILESKYIRSHIDQMDVGPAGATVVGGRDQPPKKPKDPRLRAWADALDRARAKRRAAATEPPRSFKKRK